MPRGTLFIDIDGTNHVISLYEHTSCGLEVPYPGTYTEGQPAELCPDCAEANGIEVTKKGKVKDAAKA